VKKYNKQLSMKVIYQERSHLSAHANDGKFTLCGHDYRMWQKLIVFYIILLFFSDSKKLH